MRVWSSRRWPPGWGAVHTRTCLGVRAAPEGPVWWAVGSVGLELGRRLVLAAFPVAPAVKRGTGVAHPEAQCCVMARPAVTATGGTVRERASCRFWCSVLCGSEFQATRRSPTAEP